VLLLFRGSYNLRMQSKEIILSSSAVDVKYFRILYDYTVMFLPRILLTLNIPRGVL